MCSPRSFNGLLALLLHKAISWILIIEKILWGKGPRELAPGLSALSQLPNSPLTYNGSIVKIRWRVRVRVYWGRGQEIFADRVLQLLPKPRLV